jgi:hypothetical protein
VQSPNTTPRKFCPVAATVSRVANAKVAARKGRARDADK